MLGGMERRSVVDPDADAVGCAEDFEPDVVSERVRTGSRHDCERAAAQAEDHCGGVDVAELREPRSLAHGTVRGDLRDLVAGDEADRVEVVDVQVAEDAARGRDVRLRRRRRVVRSGAEGEQRAGFAGRDRTPRGAVAVVEAALETDLDEGAGALDLVDEGVEWSQLERDGLLAERCNPCAHRELEHRHVPGRRSRDRDGVDHLHERLGRLRRFDAKLACDAAGARSVGVGERQASDAVELGERRSVVCANPADADQSDMETRGFTHSARYSMTRYTWNTSAYSRFTLIP